REAEAADRPVEQGAEDAGGVVAREAHPLDVAARGDERAHLAVGEEGIVGDRREPRLLRVGGAEGVRLDGCGVAHLLLLIVVGAIPGGARCTPAAMPARPLSGSPSASAPTRPAGRRPRSPGSGPRRPPCARPPTR